MPSLVGAEYYSDRWLTGNDGWHIPLAIIISLAKYAESAEVTSADDYAALKCAEVALIGYSLESAEKGWRDETLTLR